MKLMINNNVLIFVLCITTLSICSDRLHAQNMQVNTAQRQQLKALALNTKQQIRETRHKLVRSKTELMLLYRSYILEKDRINQLIEITCSNQMALLTQHLETQSQIRHLLNETQFNSLKDIISKAKLHERQEHLARVSKKKDSISVEQLTQLFGTEKIQMVNLKNIVNEKNETAIRIKIKSKLLIGLYKNYELNISDANTIINEINKLQKKLSLLDLKFQTELRNILSAAQFDSIIQKMP